MSTLLKKMNLKEMGCDATVARDSKYAPDKNVLLCAIFGRATGYKVWERKDNGELVSALRGKFRGVNKQEGSPDFGKLFESGMCFLPGGSQELIEGALGNADPSDQREIEFAFEIYSRYDKKSPVGYRYQVASLKQPTAADDLAELGKLVGVTLPGIEAPAEEPEPVVNEISGAVPQPEAPPADVPAKRKGK